MVYMKNVFIIPLVLSLLFSYASTSSAVHSVSDFSPSAEQELSSVLPPSETKESYDEVYQNQFVPLIKTISVVRDYLDLLIAARHAFLEPERQYYIDRINADVKAWCQSMGLKEIYDLPIESIRNPHDKNLNAMDSAKRADDRVTEAGLLPESQAYKVFIGKYWAQIPLAVIQEAIDLMTVRDHAAYLRINNYYNLRRQLSMSYR